MSKVATVFIRNTAESWDLFEVQDGVAQLPNYESFKMISPDSVGSMIDYRVVPRYRAGTKAVKNGSANQWATHYAIITRFLKTNKSRLFLCEDTLELTEENVSQIKQLQQEGVVLLAAAAKAYIIDRPAAQAVIDNCYTFYESLHAMLIDMQKLGIIHVEEKPILQKIKDYNVYFNVATALFIICMLLILLALSGSLEPRNWFAPSSSQKSISLAEMSAPKEAVMSAQGARVSSLQAVDPSSLQAVDMSSLYDVD